MPKEAPLVFETPKPEEKPTTKEDQAMKNEESKLDLGGPADDDEEIKPAAASKAKEKAKSESDGEDVEMMPVRRRANKKRRV